jgi:hypothetical protein
MSLTNKALESVTADDLQELIDNAVAEGKAIDYKETLPGNTDDNKKEFLADVTSFANTAGGHLIFGMREKASVPTEFTPIAGMDIDREPLRLLNLIRDGMQPRMPAPAIQLVPLPGGGHALVIRIPRGYNAPHMVALGNASRFYARNSRGKYQLDAGELRSAFLASEGLYDRIRSFRLDRIARIAAGEGSLPMSDQAKVVLHIVPVGPLSAAAAFNPTATVGFGQAGLFLPLYCPPVSRSRPNFDGYVFFDVSKIDDNVNLTTYLQVFRDGSIEAADDAILTPSPDMNGALVPLINPHLLEKELVIAVNRYARILRMLGAEPPLVIMVSLLGVRGYTLRVPFPQVSAKMQPIDRENLLFPEVVVDGFDFDPAAEMKPVFDRLWNTCGLPRSLNYDDEGNWTIEL